MEDLDVSIEQIIFDNDMMGMEHEKVCDHIDRMTEIAQNLEELNYLTREMELSGQAEAVATESFKSQLDSLGYADVDVSLESIGKRLREVWQAIEAGIRKSMKIIGQWFSTLSEGIDKFREKAAHIRARSRRLGDLNPNGKKITLTDEQRSLYLTSTEKHPGLIAPLKSLEGTIELMLSTEFKTTMESAKKIMPRLEIDAGKSSDAMSSEEIKDAIAEIKEDLTISGIRINMADPKFKTRVWKVKDKINTTNTKTQYLFSDKPLAGGKSLAISGPSYGSFNADPLKESMVATSSSLQKVCSAGRERAGVRTKLVTLNGTVSMPKHYVNNIEMTPLSTKQIEEAASIVISNLESLGSYRDKYEDVTTVKEKLLARGPGLLTALGDSPSKDWSQMASFKQSLLNYHVSRVDTVQTQYLRHAMRVMYAAMSVCEKSLKAYA